MVESKKLQQKTKQKSMQSKARKQTTKQNIEGKRRHNIEAENKIEKRQKTKQRNTSSTETNYEK